MYWLVIGLMLVILVFAILNTHKANKINDLEVNNMSLKEENVRLALQVNTLNDDIKKIKEAQDAVKAIEEQKKAKPQKKAAAPSGDVASRLDRLNGLSDKKS